MKEDFTEYDIKPADFINYLRYYGEHFNKKLCDFACETFNCKYYNKEKLDALLQTHKIELKQAKLHDAVYLANYTKAHYLNNGIPDEKYLVQYIKAILEKEGDLIFVKFIASMAKRGIPIEWEEMI